MIPVPAKHFAHSPYRAEHFGKSGWCGVMNKDGINCLTFLDKPGATVTNWNAALRIAEVWNNKK